MYGDAVTVSHWHPAIRFAWYGSRNMVRLIWFACMACFPSDLLFTNVDHVRRRCTETPGSAGPGLKGEWSAYADFVSI